MIELFVNGSRRSLRALRMFCTLCFMMLAVAAFAVPAKPGVTRLLTLTDGSTVNATLVGDEYLHYWLGEDGQAYQAVSLQTRRANGTNVISDNVYQTFDLESAKKSAAKRRNNANQRRARRLAPRKVGNITGNKKGLIILVNFSDVAFQSANNNALYQRIANEVGFSEGKFKGSMRDYFYAQSDGQFQLTFDVVGPVTVSKAQSYYGENDNNGDKHSAEMVIEALKLADPLVDYADYDWNNDGTVEQVYVVYAGKGEADGGADYTIWPHEWTLSSAHYYNDGAGPQTLDGVTIDTYACGGEQNGKTGETAGIGTMCHEFSHCLGYPDFYDTDYSGGQGMGYWDLMCSGSYNDDGYRPAGFTSYERWVAGWKTPTALVNTQTISNMPALQTTGSDSYIIYNKDNNDEYYLLENRQKTGWDTDLPGEGLLILHVDYDAEAWSNNQPNDDPSHQRMTWVAADNNYQYVTGNDGTIAYTFSGMKNDPFPYGSVNAFGKNTTPAATLYNENSDGTKYLDSSITDITQNSDGTISFNFNGIGSPNFSPEGRRFTGTLTVSLSCTTDGATIYYTIDGSEPTTSSNLYSSPLTISETTTVKAIAVKDEERSAVATATYTFVNSLIMADESLSFSAEAGSSETKQLTVLTEGLTADVTLTLSDDNNVFSLSTTTISKSLEDATVDVTFTPSTAGTYTGTITLTSAGAESVTVALTGTATLPVPTTPADLTLSGETPTSFTASWSAVTYAESYEIDVVKGISFEVPVLQSNFSSTTGWTLSGTGTYTGAGYYGSGSPSIKFDGTGDYAISPDFGSGTKLQFWAFGNNGSGSTFAISGLVNGSWQDIKTVTIDNGGATYEVNLPAGTSQVRFDFTKVTVNCALDDVIVYGPSVSVDGYPKSVGNVTSYDVTGLTSETQYAVRVRAVNTSGNSEWSNVASITTIANSAPELTASLGTSLNAYVGDIVEFTVTATGHPAPTTIEATCPEGAYFYFENGEFYFDSPAADTYHFVFTATNDFGTDELTVTITVSPAPVTVPTLTISNVTDDTALASWTACDGVTEYTLQLVSDDQSTTSSPILSENFKGFTGNGADVIGSNGTLDNYTSTTGWTGYKVYTANETAKIGATSSQGWIMTPALNASGTLTVVWSAYRYGTSDENTLLLGVSENGTDFVEETITIGDEKATFTNTFTVFGPTVYVRWRSSAASKARFYLDYISISTEGSLIASETVNGTSYTFDYLEPETTYYARVKGNAGWSNIEEFKTKEVPVDITLADGTDNTSVIEGNDRAYANVTLSGRTLYKDGDWNTLCLPFALSAEQIAASQLADADIRALSTASCSGGVLTLTFTDEGAVTAITAGTPYLIKWTKANDYVDDNDHNIWEPVFNGVTIDKTANDKASDLTDGKSITFKGTYGNLSFTETNTSILFLGAANKLYYPLSGATLGAQRAYFELAGLTAGAVTNARLFFGEESTGIRSLTPGPIPEQSSPTRSLSPKGEGSIYTLDGRKLDGKPTKKGLYIRNGKVVVIK